jgi:hypothetical protein
MWCNVTALFHEGQHGWPPTPGFHTNDMLDHCVYTPAPQVNVPDGNRQLSVRCGGMAMEAWMRLPLLAGFVAAAVAIPCAAVAQEVRNSPSVSVGGVIGYDKLLGFKLPTGAPFVDTEGGFAVEGQVRYATGGGFSAGGGVLYEIHGNADDNPYESFNVLGLYLEPRYLFQLHTSNITPFIGGRVAWVERKMSQTFVDARGAAIPGTDFKARGHGFGAIGGLVFSLSPRFGIEASVNFMKTWFGDWSSTGEGNSPEDCPPVTTGNSWGIISAKGTVCHSAASGSFLGPRLGFQVSF